MYFYLLFELRFNTLSAVRLILLLLRYHNSINDAKNIKTEIEQGTQKKTALSNLE